LEGRAPALVERADAGKCEGMAARPNNPEDKVRELQRTLWRCAKRSESRRFHALYDRICRGDVLWEAWGRVRANRGAAGIDGESIAAIAESGAEAWLAEIQAKLRAGEYRPSPVRRRYIPKSDGGQRPLGIPTVRDRVVQMATKLVIEPIFEADFLDCSYVLKLLRQWLEAGVLEDGSTRETLAGTPQGGVISPLLANVYLNALDRAWQAEASHLGRLVRYADDFVVLCRTTSAAKAAHKRVQDILTRLGLELHPEKTRAVNLCWGRESFDFLGCTVRKRRSILKAPHLYFMQRWPSVRAMKRLRERVHELTAVPGNPARDVKEVITALNPVLRGWGNYFATGNADDKFNHIDDYVYQRLKRWLWRRGGQRRRFRLRCWPSGRLYAMGLYRLQGTVRYPSQANLRRPSASRVPETGTHGLTGGPAAAASNRVRRP